MNRILTYNGKIATGGSGKWISRAGSEPSPYNPYNLPPQTVRFQFPAGSTLPEPAYGETWTLVDAENNIWDVSSEHVIQMLYFPDDTDILGGNLDYPGFAVHPTWSGHLRSIHSLYLGNHDYIDTGWIDIFKDRYIETVRNIDFGNITDIHGLFSGVTSLNRLNNLNIPSVTNMSELCNGCTGLLEIPEFFGINGQVADCRAAFYECRNVEYGITRLYEQLTAVQAPSVYGICFRNCGVDSPAGSEELALIPDDWK